MQGFAVRVALVTAAAIVAVTAICWSSRSPAPASPSALEAALLAPCCWGGTLASHDSPVATELRQEIEERAGRGESMVEVEADLVRRYGARIRAMPSAGIFSNALVVVVDFALAVAALLLITLHRWRRDSTSLAEGGPAEPNVDSPRDAYDERIDEELRAYGQLAGED